MTDYITNDPKFYLVGGVVDQDRDSGLALTECEIINGQARVTSVALLTEDVIQRIVKNLPENARVFYNDGNILKEQGDKVVLTAGGLEMFCQKTQEVMGKITSPDF